MGVRRVSRLSCRLAAAALLAATAACSPPGQPTGEDTSPSSISAPSTTPARAEVPVGEAVDVPIDGGSLRLVLVSIDVATSCPARGTATQEPSFGYFVVLEVSAAVEVDAATQANDPLAPVGADVLRLTSPDGTPQRISNTDASWACFDTDELLPAFVDASSPQSGLVVLDSRTAHGTVTYLPDGDSDWYWSF